MKANDTKLPRLLFTVLALIGTALRSPDVWASEFKLIHVPEIPYAFKYSEKSDCQFTKREVSIIAKAFTLLPESYHTIHREFYFEKECVSEAEQTKESVVLGTTSPGKIVFTNTAFEFIKKGAYYQVSEQTSLKTVVHELTHMLDRERKLSKTKSFRSINRWSRNIGFMLRSNQGTAEGFYRDQGAVNPKEDLSTAAEGFFFDPEFLCEHPAMYSWFLNHVGPSRVEPASCKAVSEPINPDRVAAVGFVLVSASDDHFESRFGHSALRFHGKDGNPFNDIILQAAGSVTGSIPFTGFETPWELAEKQQQQIEVGRAEIFLKGAGGMLDMQLVPTKYKLKWLETVIVEGRDISERLLDLTPLQIRILTYIINRDLVNLDTNYRFLKNNCATYLGQTLNKALGSIMIDENAFGVISPRNTYSQLESISSRTLPKVEGDQSRLERLTPKRNEILSYLQKMDIFSTVNFKYLKKVDSKNPKLAQQELKKIVEITKTELQRLTPEEIAMIQKLIYIYGLEKSLFMKAVSLELYKELAITEKK